MKKIPEDPMICLSFINTQLRDFHTDLYELCNAFQIDRQALIDKLEAVGYFYQAELNQFR